MRMAIMLLISMWPQMSDHVSLNLVRRGQPNISILLSQLLRYPVAFQTLRQDSIYGAILTSNVCILYFLGAVGEHSSID